MDFFPVILLMTCVKLSFGFLRAMSLAYAYSEMDMFLVPICECICVPIYALCQKHQKGVSCALNLAGERWFVTVV